ncbi:MAG: hypothetical protein BGP06_08205 [Rhizobiales bacterium 65-9]|nr:cellulose biosynthesis protein BcsS [Hyphomicrobiales bacterium]OJY33831.1 MAG: hypothetical protein BGP06_08205 [Rhizobiales bacterium 65-9]
MRKGFVRRLICAAAMLVAAQASASPFEPELKQNAAPPTTGPFPFVLFAGSELDPWNRYATGGFKLRPFHALGKDGFIILAAAGGGVWRETRDLALNRESDSRKFGAYALAGTELAIAGGSLGLFAGPEYFRETATDPRGVVLRRERRVGLRAHADWWSHPTERMLLTANAAAGSARKDIWMRLAFGWGLGAKGSPWGFAGPEISYYASPDSTKARIGLHWSELGRGGFRFRISGGLSKESGRKPGAYLTIGGYWAM